MAERSKQQVVLKCHSTKTGQMDGIPCRSSGLCPPLLPRIILTHIDSDSGSIRGYIVYTTLIPVEIE